MAIQVKPSFGGGLSWLQFFALIRRSRLREVKSGVCLGRKSFNYENESLFDCFHDYFRAGGGGASRPIRPRLVGADWDVGRSALGVDASGFAICQFCDLGSVAGAAGLTGILDNAGMVKFCRGP